MGRMKLGSAFDEIINKALLVNIFIRIMHNSFLEDPNANSKLEILEYIKLLRYI